LSGILKAPWQVGLAVAATIVVAAEHLELALKDLFLIGAGDSVEAANQAAIASRNPNFDSALGEVAFEQISAEVFLLIGVALLLMGIFLWVGAFRGGVRGILTVTLAVLLVGGIVPLVMSFTPSHRIDLLGLLIEMGVNLVAFVFVLLLWSGSGRKWVSLGAKKKWDQD
jgi:hypothetical protein